MSVVTIQEKIHHGNYRNTRIGVLPALDRAAVSDFMNKGPHRGPGYTESQVATVLSDLTENASAELGWATYTTHKVPEGAMCDWYAVCDHPAVAAASTRVIDHPVLVCQRCVDLFTVDERERLQVVNFPRDLTEVSRNIEDDFTLVREENGDVKKVDILDVLVDGTSEAHIWTVTEREKSCEHESLNQDCEDCQTTDFPVTPGIVDNSEGFLYYLITEEARTDKHKDVKYVY